MCVCVCVCVVMRKMKERERGGEESEKNFIIKEAELIYGINEQYYLQNIRHSRSALTSWKNAERKKTTN